MSEFTDGLKLLEAYFKDVADSVLSKFDRITYGMLVNCLKSNDPDAIKDALDQLAREKRPLAIAPIYLVSKSHPIAWVRQQAENVLPQLVNPQELTKVTDGLDTKSAVAALVQKYGHFRAD